jgi:hypothetical protein
MDENTTSKAGRQTGVTGAPAITASATTLAHRPPLPRLLLLAGILFAVTGISTYLAQTPRSEPASARSSATRPEGQSGPSASAASSSAHESGSVTSGAKQNTTVTVNGQRIAVPENGEVHEVIDNDNGTTKVDYSASSTSNGSSSHATTNISVQSSNSGSTSTGP